MPLTDSAIRALVPTDKPRKVFDGHGLYVYLLPKGTRLWRMKCRFAGKERTLTFGAYPEVSLKEARNQRDDARRLLRQGIDPSAARRAAKEARSDRGCGTFEVVAREWLVKMSGTWESMTEVRIRRRLETYVFPIVGHRPIKDIRAPDLLKVLQRIEGGKPCDTAHRVRQYLGQIFRYAVATNRSESDPTPALRGALLPVAKGSLVGITEPSKVGPLLRAIDGYWGHDTVRLALQVLPLLLIRAGVLRGATWDEFEVDWDTGLGRNGPPLWRIPAKRMKMRIAHVVPLSTQAVGLFTELHRRTGPEGLVLRGLRDRSRPLSENTLNAALKSLGYGDQMTTHGFRHLASTLLHERGYRSEWIERQIAHKDRNDVRAAYNFAEHLNERRTMMQDWADYLESLKRANSC